MESRPPSIPHPPFPRPSLFSTAPQHSRQYGSQQVSRTDARAHASHDVLQRQENESSRAAPAYSLTAQSYNPDTRSQTRSISPTRFGALQSDAAKHSALASSAKHNGILGKESIFYRDGKEYCSVLLHFFFFFLSLFLSFYASGHGLALPTLSSPLSTPLSSFCVVCFHRTHIYDGRWRSPGQATVLSRRCLSRVLIYVTQAVFTRTGRTSNVMQINRALSGGEWDYKQIQPDPSASLQSAQCFVARILALYVGPSAKVPIDDDQEKPQARNSLSVSVTGTLASLGQLHC